MRMHLRSRVFLMTALWAMMLLTITGVLSWRARSSEKAFTDLFAGDVTTIAALDDFVRNQNAYRDLWTRSDAGEDQLAARLTPRYRPVLQLLESPRLSTVDPALVGRAGAFEQLLHRVEGAWPSSSRDQRESLVAEIVAESDSIASIGYSLSIRHRREVNSALASLSRQTRDTMWSSLAIAWIIAIFAFALARRTLQNVVVPIEKLSRSSEAIAEGSLETRAPVGGDVEIRRLGEAFNRMTAALVASHEELRARARTDDLTNLPNFRALGEAIIREIDRSDRYEQSFGLLVLDLDHFKKYNDSYGHLAGNEALQMTAATIRETIRSVDFPARYGGEEFVILAPFCDHEGLAQTAERVRTAVAALPSIAERRKLTVSIGGALYPSDGVSADELFAAADRRLYQAKEGGRNRVVLPGPSNVVRHAPQRRRKE
jgi:diguanylate cyclase (GGDEF)-like protein